MRNWFASMPWLVIIGTLLSAMVLNITSYPDWMAYAKPDWVLLVLFYWCVGLPNKVSVTWGWFTGLLMDVLSYSPLGLHTITKSLIALLANLAYQRIRLYSMWQQCSVVFILCCMDIAVISWINLLIMDTPIRLVYWQSALTTSLIWPLVYNFLRIIRQRISLTDDDQAKTRI